MNVPNLYWEFALVFCLVIGIAAGGTIIEGPTDVTVGLDRVVVFKCHVNKSDDEEVHWLLDGQLLFRDREMLPYVISPADAVRFSLIGLSVDDYDLQITQVILSDARQYTCKIQPKQVGTKPVEQSANLTVHRAPRKMNPDCSANGESSFFKFEAGSDVLFTCESEPSIPNVELEWIDREDNSSIDSTLDDSSAIYVQRYFQQNLSLEDTGKVFVCRSIYESEAIDNLTGSCKIGPLDILFPPESISIDGTGLAEYGKTLLLTCNATGGNPQTNTYEWSVYPKLPTKRMYASSNVLSIHKVIESDDGLIVVCSATNGIGDTLRTNVTVNVTKPTIITAPPAVVTTADTSNLKTVFPLSIAYILVFILVGLILLLGSVCIVLYLLIRKRRRRTTPAIVVENFGESAEFGRMHKWLDDTGSVNSWRSEPGYSVYDRGYGPDIELSALKANRYKSQDNVYRTAYPGESVSQTVDMSPLLPRRRGISPPAHLDDAGAPSKHVTIDTSDPSHVYYRPASTSSDPSYFSIDMPGRTEAPHDVEYFPQVMPVRRPRKSPYDRPYDNRRLTIPLDYKPQEDVSPRSRRRQKVTHSEVYDDQDNRAFMKYLSTAAGHIPPEPPSPVRKQRNKVESPVMRYKHRRQASGGSLKQVLHPHDPASYRSSPSQSPKVSPLASPVRRPHVANRPLPDSEPEIDELQMEYKKFDDIVNEFQSAKPKKSEEVPSDGHLDHVDTKTKAITDPHLRLWLYQQESNGKFLDNTNGNFGDEEYDEDDVFVIVDEKGQGNDDEGYCSVHGYGSACGCESSTR